MDRDQRKKVGEARQMGQRLAALLAASELPNDQKQAWATLVPEMTFEQLDEFSDALAAKQLGPIRAELEVLKKELDEIKAERDVAVADATQEAEDSIAALMAEIDAKDQSDA
jgi:hypothetical protein